MPFYPYGLDIEQDRLRVQLDRIAQRTDPAYGIDSGPGPRLDIATPFGVRLHELLDPALAHADFKDYGAAIALLRDHETLFPPDQLGDAPEFQWGEPARHSRALILAARHGHCDVVRHLLIWEESEADPRYWHGFALKAAVDRGHVECVRLLVEDGRCDTRHSNAVTGEGPISYPLRGAILADSAEMVEIADADPRVARVNGDKYAAYAVNEDRWAALDALLDLGRCTPADVRAAMTPWARLINGDHCTRYLEAEAVVGKYEA